jgi:hypothetical protein
MYDSMHIVEVHQSLQDSFCYLADDVYGYSAVLPADVVKRSITSALH